MHPVGRWTSTRWLVKQFEDLITLTAYWLRTKPTQLEDLWLGGTFVICQLALASRSAVPYVLDILRAESGSPSIMAVVCLLQSIKGMVPSKQSFLTLRTIGKASQEFSGMWYCNQTPFLPCEGWDLAITHNRKSREGEGVTVVTAESPTCTINRVSCLCQPIWLR